MVLHLQYIGSDYLRKQPRPHRRLPVLSVRCSYLRYNQYWAHRETVFPILPHAAQTAIYSVLGKRKISLMGGTGDAGKVSANGKIYEDADAYALIRNNDGKIKVYKENIYQPMPGCRFIASKTDRSKYLLLCQFKCLLYFSHLI